MAGKQVTFVLGAQTAAGTTGSNGIATANIKLSQKPGSYQLGASFPSGDAKYTEASASGTFVIGK